MDVNISSTIWQTWYIASVQPNTEKSIILPLEIKGKSFAVGNTDYCINYWFYIWKKWCQMYHKILLFEPNYVLSMRDSRRQNNRTKRYLYWQNHNDINGWSRKLVELIRVISLFYYPSFIFFLKKLVVTIILWFCVVWFVYSYRVFLKKSEILPLNPVDSLWESFEGYARLTNHWLFICAKNIDVIFHFNN